MVKKEILQKIDDISEDLCSLSDLIWDHPEVKYTEHYASTKLKQYLKEQGFNVADSLANIPTAFKASFGKGSPVIGLLAEYDALEGMSQVANAFQKAPITEGKPGHGCGHNLLGVGSVGAAVLLKKYLEHKGKGTVILFGCPAEEGGSGKTFMARDGVFNELDIALTWHPADVNEIATGSSLANCQISYHFTGRASHAAISPHLGRSALDAVQLMNMGVEFLREHVPDHCRIHYAITNAGGNSPNVVPDEAEVLYLIRAPYLQEVHGLVDRVNDIAKGASLMTKTSLKPNFIKACSNILTNRVLQVLLHDNFTKIGSANYDIKDYEFATKMKASFEDADTYYLEKINEIEDEELRLTFLEDSKNSIYTKLLPLGKEVCSFASSDVGDVSWICPTAQFTVTTMPGGTSMHSWQEVAVGKSAMAKKGMLQAVKVLAASAIDVYDNPELIKKAKIEKERKLGNLVYHCPIPDDIAPPISTVDYNSCF